MRLCAISVDLDEIPFYHRIHGLAEPEPASASLVYDVALERLESLARAHDAPLTLFTIGESLERAESAARLRAMSDAGHEIGNHSARHYYDLSHREDAVIRDEIERADAAIFAATSQRPRGFRAPGYTVNDRLLGHVRDLGYLYDSSVFPSPLYYSAKTLALGLIALRGRRSHSVADVPQVLLSPARPYRMGTPYWKRGDGLRELPVQVTRGLRLPFIGTTLTLAGPEWARRLTRGVVGEPLVNLELHGVDVLDEEDGLAALRPYQPDIRVPRARKLEALSAVCELLHKEGYTFVRLTEAAQSSQLFC